MKDFYIALAGGEQSLIRNGHAEIMKK